MRCKSFGAVSIIDMEAMTMVWDFDEGGLAVNN